MKPLRELHREEARGLRGLLFDLDDTLLSHGTLTREAYSALWELKDSGLILVAVTGRPSGWGEILARQWPIDAAITENGAIALERRGNAIRRIDPCSEAERRARRIKLSGIVERARDRVPEARLADDVDARTSDVTWDIAETMRLPEDRIQLLISEIVNSDARWTRSSVHLHATFDTYDKASGAIAWLLESRNEDAGSVTTAYGYIGDSGNDRPCFSAFRVTFGVANIRAATSQLAVLPAYVSDGEMGRGFAEIARAIATARKD